MNGEKPREPEPQQEPEKVLEKNEPVLEQKIEEDIRKKIEETAKKYNFENLGWMFSDNFPEDNKVFLAMMDDYLTKTDLKLPEEEIRTFDFGCGWTPYFDGLLNFYMKYQKNPSEIRHVRLLAWEGNQDIPTPAIPQGYPRSEYTETDRISVYLENEKEQENIEELKWVAQEYKGKLDVVTMFDLGPSPDYFQRGGDYISTPLRFLKDFIKDEGIVILTTTFGGQDKEKAIKTLMENGFEVMVDDENKYKAHFKNFPHQHDNIIIAKKNKKEG